MSNWNEIKARARKVVHKTFSSGFDDDGNAIATYTPPGGAPLGVTVRLHTNVRLMGDLDREGYGKVLGDVNRLIFDREEVEPKRLGVLTFSDGSVYSIETVLPNDGPNDPVEIVCEVVKVAP